MGNGVSAGGGGSDKPSPWLLEMHAEHDGSVNCMASSEDGGILATGSDDCSIRLWTTATNIVANVGILKGHTKYVTALTIAEGFIVSGSADKTLKKWDISTGECVQTYIGHQGMINRLICSGELIFTSSYDATARCWLFNNDSGLSESDLCVRVFRGHSKGVYPLIFIPADEEWKEDDPGATDVLITGSGDGTARTWSVETGRTIVTYRGHTGSVHALTVDMEGKVLYTGSSDGTIKSWEILSGEMLKEFVGHNQSITALQVVNRFLFSASSDRTVKSWVIEFGEVARTFRGHKHSVSCLLIHNGIVYTGCGDGLVRGYEAKSGVLKRVFKGHEFTVNTIKIVNGKLFSGSFDNSLRIWDLENIRNATHPYKAGKDKEKEAFVDSAISSATSSRQASTVLPRKGLPSPEIEQPPEIY